MKNYDQIEPSKNISYFDMNDLYGCDISHYLPYSVIKSGP